jgi:hypothetical protein
VKASLRITAASSAAIKGITPGRERPPEQPERIASR